MLSLCRRAVQAKANADGNDHMQTLIGGMVSGAQKMAESSCRRPTVMYSAIAILGIPEGSTFDVEKGSGGALNAPPTEPLSKTTHVTTRELPDGTIVHTQEGTSEVHQLERTNKERTNYGR